MTWKFGAHVATMYTHEIETKWAIEHHGGGGWYLDVPKCTIPHENAYFHKWSVARQAVSDVGGVSIKLSPHDDLEQTLQITL
jgi:hypothetical protein